MSDNRYYVKFTEFGWFHPTDARASLFENDDPSLNVMLSTDEKVLQRCRRIAVQ